ncbi:MAG: hypothetical protein M3Z09_10475 [Acidobacteriota bacterium]|nr:hypothetical protein [Acidobacteriota bacterium]
MLPQYREPFNRNFKPEHYARFLQHLNQRCGAEVTFRNSETPCFYAPGLLQQMADAGADMTERLAGDKEYLAAADNSIPAKFRVPEVSARPLFVQADFGIIRNAAGQIEPRLVEIQGFPSLYAYQIELARTYAEAYRLPDELTPLLGGRNPETYRKLVRAAILGEHDPENVVLLEIDPWQQKTLADFLLTEKMCGVRTVDVRDVRKEGTRLVYKRDGRTIPIHRIYNRVIADELVRKQIPLGFDFRDELQVEWAGHPNWFFRLSKFSLPYLRHPFVPRSQFLDQVQELPPDLDNVVLKPLFSFAGLGVIIGPTRQEIDAIPAEQRGNYLLQDRVHFEPVIATPHGATYTEVRIMYIWAEKLEAVTTIIRMGRGKMMGVDQNRDLEWVGASAGFMPDPMLR